MNAIDINNITKIFGKGKYRFKALDRVSLKIKRGEIYGLLGPNGAGKTTLIYILSNLLLPDKGSATILGYDAIENTHELREKMNVCFGNSYFFSSFSPKRILKYYCYLYDIPRLKMVQKINEVIELLKITPFKDKEFSTLSKGMKQKIALAKSLLNDPEVLLLDEPTIGLDVDVANEVRMIFRDLSVEKDTTILLTSHYMEEVETLCKRITLLNNGRVIREGNIDTIKKSIRAPDTISLILNNYDKLNFVRKIKGVKEFSIEEGRLKILTSSSTKTIENVLREMRRKRKKVLDLEVKSTTLEEAFIKIVGEKNA
jgi:ABC-2 type transport system ATP-binding protein